MQRKILGNRSYTLYLSLPSSWAKKHALQLGGAIDVTERKDGALVITPIKPVTLEPVQGVENAAA